MSNRLAPSATGNFCTARRRSAVGWSPETQHRSTPDTGRKRSTVGSNHRRHAAPVLPRLPVLCLMTRAMLRVGRLNILCGPPQADRVWQQLARAPTEQHIRQHSAPGWSTSLGGWQSASLTGSGSWLCAIGCCTLDVAVPALGTTSAARPGVLRGPPATPKSPGSGSLPDGQCAPRSTMTRLTNMTTHWREVGLA